MPKSEDAAVEPEVVDADAVATSEPVADPEPDPVAELAAEAEPPAKPDGSPDLVPFHKLRRRERERLIRALAKLEVSNGALETARRDDDDSGDSLSRKADQAAVLADVEDVVLSAAKDPTSCEQWVAVCTDDDLVGLLRWYTSVMRVGEAPTSSS